MIGCATISVLLRSRRPRPREGSFNPEVMSEQSIVIVDCLEGALADYCFRRMAGYFEDGYRIERLEAPKGAFPGNPGEWAASVRAAGMIIGGSQHSPFDKEPWMTGLVGFLGKIALTGLPVLGICFGLEALAVSLGGSLGRRGELTVALREVRITERDALFAGLGEITWQPVAHEVMVSSVPDGFRITAVSDDCPVQAMRHEMLPVYGVQFHPEMDRDIKIYDEDWIGLDDESFERSEGPAVMRNFVGIVKSCSK